VVADHDLAIVAQSRAIADPDPTHIAVVARIARAVARVRTRDAAAVTSHVRVALTHVARAAEVTKSHQNLSRTKQITDQSRSRLRLVRTDLVESGRPKGMVMPAVRKRMTRAKWLNAPALQVVTLSREIRNRSPSPDRSRDHGLGLMQTQSPDQSREIRRQIVGRRTRIKIKLFFTHATCIQYFVREQRIVQ